MYHPTREKFELCKYQFVVETEAGETIDLDMKDAEFSEVPVHHVIMLPPQVREMTGQLRVGAVYGDGRIEFSRAMKVDMPYYGKFNKLIMLIMPACLIHFSVQLRLHAWAHYYTPCQHKMCYVGSDTKEQVNHGAITIAANCPGNFRSLHRPDSAHVGMTSIFMIPLSTSKVQKANWERRDQMPSEVFAGFPPFCFRYSYCCSVDKLFSRRDSE